jgi:hypothetical protein
MLALIILTFMYTTEFKERFGTVLSAVIGYLFAKGEKGDIK